MERGVEKVVKATGHCPVWSLQLVPELYNCSMNVSLRRKCREQPLSLGFS